MSPLSAQLAALGLSILFSVAGLYQLVRGLRLRSPAGREPGRRYTLGDYLVRRDLLTEEGIRRVRTAFRLYVLGLVSLATALWLR